MVMTLRELNDMSTENFVYELGSIYEQTPWIAKKAADDRPYVSVEELYQRMVEIVRDSTKDEKLELIRSHPNLGENIEMSHSSVAEQQGAGLKNLTSDEYKKFQTLNFHYMKKFKFPFIVAVKGKSKDEIFDLMCDRIANTPFSEFDNALLEINQIARFRLEEKIR